MLRICAAEIIKLLTFFYSLLVDIREKFVIIEILLQMYYLLNDENIKRGKKSTNYKNVGK